MAILLLVFWTNCYCCREWPGTYCPGKCRSLRVNPPVWNLRVSSICVWHFNSSLQSTLHQGGPTWYPSPVCQWPISLQAAQATSWLRISQIFWVKNGVLASLLWASFLGDEISIFSCVQELFLASFLWNFIPLLGPLIFWALVIFCSASFAGLAFTEHLLCARHFPGTNGPKPDKKKSFFREFKAMKCKHMHAHVHTPTHTSTHNGSVSLMLTTE